jgi:RACo middle region
MMNPGDKELTRVVREAMDTLIGKAAREAGTARGEILEVTLVGNPIMHHLVLGLDPTELGGAPFALTIDAAYEAGARTPPRRCVRRVCLRAALHRGPCRRGRGRGPTGRGPALQGRTDSSRRCRHQR